MPSINKYKSIDNKQISGNYKCINSFDSCLCVRVRQFSFICLESNYKQIVCQSFDSKHIVSNISRYSSFESNYKFDHEK